MTICTTELQSTSSYESLKVKIFEYKDKEFHIEQKTEALI